MPKKCSKCVFFSPENSLQNCPDCGAALQFTMFSPDGLAAGVGHAGSAPTASTKPAWQDETLAQHEIIEAPLAMRLGQIGSGVLAFFMLSRWGQRLAFLLFLSGAEESPPAVLFMLAIAMSALIYIAAALFGGAVAGAWTVNWVPQGIGVGLGVLIVPLLLLLLFVPSWMPLALYVGLTFVTTFFTVLGAFIGHKVVRPTRVIVS